MKIAYFDCSSGVSGDMLLGALVDSGVSLDRLTALLSELPLEGYELKVEETSRKGIRAKKVDVVIDKSVQRKHTHYSDIDRMVRTSGLPPQVKEGAMKVFERIGKAEAAVHGVSLEKVHFHEVGAVDSIVDVVGTVIGFYLLEIEKIFFSPINTGSGTVHCDHGIMPVPAPATAHLLKGFPSYSTGVEKELATPTGVGVLTALGERAGAQPLMVGDSIGHGAGGADLPDHANLLRVIVGESGGEGTAERVGVIECQIDDMNPELYEGVMERLFEKGALDVYWTAITMKKSRPATEVTVIAPLQKVDTLSDTLLTETSTFGVRLSQRERKILEREFVDLKTPYGTVKGKVGKLDGAIVKVVPEYGDCLTLARKKEAPVKEVYEAAQKEAREYRVLTEKKSGL